VLGDLPVRVLLLRAPAVLLPAVLLPAVLRAPAVLPVRVLGDVP